MRVSNFQLKLLGIESKGLHKGIKNFNFFLVAKAVQTFALFYSCFLGFVCILFHRIWLDNIVEMMEWFVIIKKDDPKSLLCFCSFFSLLQVLAMHAHLSSAHFNSVLC